MRPNYRICDHCGVWHSDLMLTDEESKEVRGALGDIGRALRELVRSFRIVPPRDEDDQLLE